MKVSSIHYIEIKHKSEKKILSDQINVAKKYNVTKMHSFFFQELQLVTVLLSIRDFYINQGTRLVSLKVCMNTFVRQKAWTL